MSALQAPGMPRSSQASQAIDQGRQWLNQLVRFDSASRLYDIEIEGITVPLAVEGFIADEALSQLYEFKILLLSTDALMDLDTLLWKYTRLWITHSDGSRQPRSGFVREAMALESDGGLARYQLILAPWLWLSTQQVRSRVYQQQGVLNIIEQLLAAYAPEAAWRLDEGVREFMQAIPARLVCTQYRETDHAFLLRLLREEGLGYYFEELPLPQESAGSSQCLSQCLVLFSNSSRFTEDSSSQSPLGGLGVRLHRHSSPQDQDSVQQLRRLRPLSGGAVTAAAWDPQGKRVVAASLAAPPAASAAVGPSLERYLWAGHGSRSSAVEMERAVLLSQEAAEATQQRFEGEATVRSFRPGRWFLLTEPTGARMANARDRQAHAGTGANDTFAAQGSSLALISVRSVGINNLPVAIARAAEALRGNAVITALQRCLSQTDPAVEPSHGRQLMELAAVQGFSCHFQAQAAAVPWRPAQAGEHRGARAEGPQSARVVGLAGSSESLCRDTQGRILLRFHWQRGETPQDEHSGWVRIAQRHGGSGMGCSFVPRIGQEVLVGFLDNDIDQPVVLGALYNGRGEGGQTMPPGEGPATHSAAELFAKARNDRASAQGNRSGGNAPAWHGASADSAGHRNAAGLMGFKTQELSGSGHNQLQFDDHDQELRCQLASTQGTSQLNLGHLIHTADNFRGSARGAGLELRSDRATALRGEAGVLISTWHDPGLGAQSTPIGEITGPLALLNQAQGLATAFDEASRLHKTVGISIQHGRGSTPVAPLAAMTKAVGSTVNADCDRTARAEAASHRQASSTPDSAGRAIPHLGLPMVVTAGRAGLALVAAESIQMASGHSTLIATGGDLNLACAQQLSLHSGQAIGLLAGATQAGDQGTGLGLIAAQGPLRIEAQNDHLDLHSAKALHIASSNDSITFAAATAIRLVTAGGASIEIEGGNITVQCPGTLRIHAAQHQFAGPTQLSREMNAWPETPFDERFQLVHRDGTAARNYRYAIHREDGAILHGVTDAEGWTAMQKALGPEELSIELLGPVAEERDE